jgi:hypothetical protein
MKKAWVENGFIRDVAHTTPSEIYHPDIAKLYDTDVPDDTENGDLFENGVVSKPPPPVIVPVEPPPPPAPVIPQVVTMAQARKALILGGIPIASVDSVIAGIADATERALAQTDWEYNTAVRRDSALVASIAPLLGLTSERIDGLFIAAAKL